ncbi:hypothetical protein JD844_018056, partial [Phrynosoma platyrhinos]
MMMMMMAMMIFLLHFLFMEKALTVTQDVNCVRHFIPECVQHLQELKERTQKGLLYGIPVSIKDHIGYKGHLSTCGFTQSLNVLQEEDSVLVKVLKKQGANPFVFTNVSQSLFNYDCSNSIFGQTVNPFDHKRTPGGSSGGEGALIAGDLLFLLSYLSVYYSNSGVRGPIDGILSVIGTVGPMARDVDSLVLCMKALLCEDLFQLDPMVPPMPFNEELLHDLPPFPFFALKQSENDIVDSSLKSQVNCFSLPNLVKKILSKIIKPWVVLLMDSAVKADRHRFIMQAHMVKMWILAQMVENTVSTTGQPPECIVWNSVSVVLCSNKYVKMKPMQEQTVNNLWAHHDQVMAYRQRFADEWKKCKLDVVLCPVLGPAFILGYPAKLPTAISSTMLFNVLNFPAGIVPITTVTEADEEEMREYQGLYGDPWDKKLQE